jgi:hypothetical protein
LIDSYRSSYDEQEKFWNDIGLSGVPEEKSSPLFIRKALETVNRAAAIFSIQLLHDWLSLGEFFPNPWEFRVNFPGTMSDRNWTIVMPLSLEEMMRLPLNKEISRMNRRTNRA